MRVGVISTGGVRAVWFIISGSGAATGNRYMYRCTEDSRFGLISHIDSVFRESDGSGGDSKDYFCLRVYASGGGIELVRSAF